MTNKIHSTKFAEITDPDLINEVKEMYRVAKDNITLYKELLKDFCESVRKVCNETCVIGLTLAKKTDTNEEVLLVLFYEDVVATDDNYFHMALDEGGEMPYLILEEEEGVK